jgi:hypothetical protein
MAASGAAANANAAYIGSGITRDRLISLVMIMLNTRLGLWLNAPRSRMRPPNYLMPGLYYGLFNAGHTKESSFVELTDGGHFDNLGVYELIRRRTDLILALDSEEDPTTAMAALASVCDRVDVDFGTMIEVGDRADVIAPASDLGYPPGAKFTPTSYFVSKIRYPRLVSASNRVIEEAKEGIFVYVKSNMIKELSFPAKGYKAKNPDFPNQSTMDQFFEPAQFEAYRELGYAAMAAVVGKFNLEQIAKAEMFAKLKGAS